MRRYWIDDSLEIGIPYAISGELFKHIHVVCRQNVGDEFELLPATTGRSGKKADSQNKDLKSEAYLYHVKVKDIFRHTMVVDVVSRRSIPLIPKPHIHLALSLPKVKTLESVVEKIVELGVYSLTPFYSDYSFLKSKDRMNAKSQRFRKIVISACQQSARAEELFIDEPRSFDEILQIYQESKNQGNVRAYAFYEGKAQSLSSYWKEENLGFDSQNTSVSDIWVFIGSEGGFSRAEIEKFKSYEIPSLSIGEQVLRVETACVSIVSVLKYKYELF